MKIQDLKPNPKNPRKISDEQKQMLTKAIEKFGDLGGVVFNVTSGFLLGGHQRVSVFPKDAKIEIDTKYKKPTKTGTVAEGSIILNGEKFKYHEVKWDKITEEAAMIAANKQGGEWENGKLVEILKDLVESIDMDLVGFSPDELKKLLPKIEENPADPDQIPGTSGKPKTVLGDVYELGKHRLVCGDATSVNVFDLLMKNIKPDLVYTDPPYGVNVVKSEMVGADFGVAKKGKYKEVLGDATTEAAKEFYQACLSFELRNMIIWGGNYFTDFLPPKNSWVIWNKRGDTGIKNTFADGELAWSSIGHPVRIHNQLWNGMIRAGEKDKRVHPTQKPVALAEFCFELVKDCKTVFDGFGGSGTTLIACEKTDRQCFMMELSPEYCDIIISRYLIFTNQKEVIRNGQVIEWKLKKAK